MTSLYPGMLFYSSGLNKNSTPYGPEVTPSEIEQKLGRVPFNGRPWPKSSPVSTIYDVRNSSTRMIILNNKLSKKPKGSRLRGQSDYQGEIQHPEPFRHVTDETHTNWEHHKTCTSSVTQKFVPKVIRSASPLPEWVNKTQRPPMRFDNGSGVNPNHHIQCRGHNIDYDIVRWYNTHRRPRAQSRTSSVRENRTMSPILNDPNLSKGERRYLNSIAKIYSVDNMRVQKQHQYNQLMFQEMSKGMSKDNDWAKYHRYLNTPRKTQFGPCDPQRSQSVAGSRKSKRDLEDSRPHTTQTARPTRDSQGTSRERLGSNKSRDEQSKQKGGNKRYGLKGKETQKKNNDLTGRPAPVESPLPLMPKRDSISSLSSISSNEDDKDKSKSRKTKEVSPPQERGKRAEIEKKNRDESDDKKDTGKVKVEDKIIKQEEENKNSDDDKRKEEDEDERSKMSARENNTAREEDQPGRGVEYIPVYGERQGHDNNRSVEERSARQTQGDDVENFCLKSPKQDENARKEKQADENPVVLLPPAKEVTSGSSNSQEDYSNGPKLIHHSHREGGDRPLSRLGGRGQFTLVKKGSDYNSDDDYSDDDEKDTAQRTGKKFDDATTDQPRGDNSNFEISKLPKKSGSDDVHLTLYKEDVGSLNDNGDEMNTAPSEIKDSPTGASSLEKQSSITTVEY